MNHGAILTELARAKALFQLRALAAVMGVPREGIEARSGETRQGLDPQDESPAPSGARQPYFSSSEIHHG
jgi:hypothetical protein